MAEKQIKEQFSHYFKDVSHLTHVDIYRILSLFNVTNPNLQHAIKKLMVAGGRGHKDMTKDVNEAIVTLNRFVEMQKEDEALGAGDTTFALNSSHNPFDINNMKYDGDLVNRITETGQDVLRNISITGLNPGTIVGDEFHGTVSFVDSEKLSKGFEFKKGADNEYEFTHISQRSPKDSIKNVITVRDRIMSGELPDKWLERGKPLSLSQHRIEGLFTILYSLKHKAKLINFDSIINERLSDLEHQLIDINKTIVDMIEQRGNPSQLDTISSDRESPDCNWNKPCKWTAPIHMEAFANLIKINGQDLDDLEHPYILAVAKQLNDYVKSCTGVPISTQTNSESKDVYEKFAEVDTSSNKIQKIMDLIVKLKECASVSILSNQVNLHMDAVYSFALAAYREAKSDINQGVAPLIKVDIPQESFTESIQQTHTNEDIIHSKIDVASYLKVKEQRDQLLIQLGNAAARFMESKTYTSFAKDCFKLISDIEKDK